MVVIFCTTTSHWYSFISYAAFSSFYLFTFYISSFSLFFKCNSNDNNAHALAVQVIGCRSYIDCPATQIPRSTRSSAPQQVLHRLSGHIDSSVHKVISHLDKTKTSIVTFVIIREVLICDGFSVPVLPTPTHFTITLRL